MYLSEPCKKGRHANRKVHMVTLLLFGTDLKSSRDGEVDNEGTFLQWKASDDQELVRAETTTTSSLQNDVGPCYALSVLNPLPFPLYPCVPLAQPRAGWRRATRPEFPTRSSQVNPGGLPGGTLDARVHTKIKMVFLLFARQETEQAELLRLIGAEGYFLEATRPARRAVFSFDESKVRIFYRLVPDMVDMFLVPSSSF